METVLDLSGVHTYYGASHILRGVSFRLAAGECMSLMGRNGMGKSTTLRTIVGLVKPVKGTVTALGRETRRMETYEIAAAGVAYVPEGRGIFPDLTVVENLVMAARSGADGRSEWTLEEVFEVFPRLAERKESWGNNLSGGEQQMLTIGRALMTNPRILLLDEATEGLAPLIREDIWRVIERIKASGIACIIVDKNVNKLVELADRHVVLVKGQVVFDGDGKTLMKDPTFLHRHLGV
jgi:branched-chain amino acid transport system ATP-binding protein